MVSSICLLPSCLPGEIGTKPFWICAKEIVSRLNLSQVAVNCFLLSARADLELSCAAHVGRQPRLYQGVWGIGIATAWQPNMHDEVQLSGWHSLGMMWFGKETSHMVVSMVVGQY